MKKLLYFIPVAIAMLLGACEKSPLTRYEEGNTIYFKQARWVSGRDGTPVDSAFFSFMYAKADTVYLPILVSVAGKVVPEDRPYRLIVDTGSTATLNKDVFFGDMVIRANVLNDTFWVKLARTPEMKTSTLLMRVKLLPNENFKTDFPDREMDGDDIPFHTYRIYVNDRASKPTRWFEPYLGPFTGKKARLLTEMYNFDFEKDFAPPYGPSAELNFQFGAGLGMQRWLNEKALAKEEVLEDDGTPMVMGSLVQ